MTTGNQAKAARTQAELDIQLQIAQLNTEINKEPISFRKVKVEMNKAEEKMRILRNIHANYCKIANISASSPESLTYIGPISAKFHAKMDEAQEAIDAHDEAVGEAFREELEDQITKVKCNVDSKMGYINKAQEKEITPQLHEAVRRNQALIESYLETHDKILQGPTSLLLRAR